MVFLSAAEFPCEKYCKSQMLKILSNSPLSNKLRLYYNNCPQCQQKTLIFIHTSIEQTLINTSTHHRHHQPVPAATSDKLKCQPTPSNSRANIPGQRQTWQFSYRSHWNHSKHNLYSTSRTIPFNIQLYTYIQENKTDWCNTTRDSKWSKRDFKTQSRKNAQNIALHNFST
jgi:hypothetical protein